MPERNLHISLQRELNTTLAEAEWLLNKAEEAGVFDTMMGFEDWELDLVDWCKEERTRLREEAIEEGEEVPDTPSRTVEEPPEFPGRKPGRHKEIQRQNEVEEKRHISQRTKDHADVAAKLVAHYAARREDVIEFRHHFLNDGLVSPEQACEMKAFKGFLAQGERWVGVVEGLATSYGWSHEAALWFLLTGEAPEIDTIRVEHVPLGDDPNAPVAIQLTVFPGALAQEVNTAYRAAQYEFLGGDNRPLSDNMLRMFRFVLDQESDPEHAPSSREQMKLWDKKYGEGRTKYLGLQRFNLARKRAERIIRRFISGSTN